MADAPNPLVPTAEHARLEDNVGRWNVQCTYHLGGGQQPMQATGQDTIERVGPFWTLSHLRSDLMGAPFVGRAAVGYDPRTGKWVSTWIDSMSPFLYVLEGGFDASGKVLELTCDTIGADGQPLRLRTREEHRSRDHRVLDMFRIDEAGAETQVFRYEYRRAR
ncbi:MAG: DUF1579 family protein [Planctomycetota bacterium]